MDSPTRVLAEFGSNLSFREIPKNVIDQAGDAILDTVGVSIFGADLPWSWMIIDYATHYGSGGTSTIIGTQHHVAAPLAALANGALAHRFEMDNLRQPSEGVHHGATLMPAAFAVGEESARRARYSCSLCRRLGSDVSDRRHPDNPWNGRASAEALRLFAGSGGENITARTPAISRCNRSNV
jgi:2-methylcitrate dehydratase PrpD